MLLVVTVYFPLRMMVPACLYYVDGDHEAGFPNHRRAEHSYLTTQHFFPEPVYLLLYFYEVGVSPGDLLFRSVVPL